MRQFMQAVISTINIEANSLFFRIRGQSNPKGNGDATDLTELDVQYQGTFDNVKVWTGSAFVSLDTENDNFNQFPESQREGGFGPSISCAIKLATLTGKTVYVFSYTVGSTGLIGGGINGSWNIDDDDLFQASKVEELAAIAWLEANNVNYDDIGEIWWQGESDRGQGGLPTSYVNGLTEYISERRAYNGAIPFFIVNLHTNYASVNQGWTDIISAQNTVAAADSNVFIVPTGSMYAIDTITPDNTIHINSEGQQDLGEDLADIIISSVL